MEIVLIVAKTVFIRYKQQTHTSISTLKQNEMAEFSLLLPLLSRAVALGTVGLGVVWRGRSVAAREREREGREGERNGR